MACLKDGEKKFGALRSETSLSPRALSNYLKNLQKLRLVSRDVDSRRYYMKEISVEVLFFNDVLNFMQGRLEKMVASDKKSAGIFPAGIGWMVLTEDLGAFQNNLKTTLERPENSRALAKISAAIEHLWDSSVLSKFNKNEKETIRTYRNFLLKLLKRLYKQPNKSERKNAYEMVLQVTRIKMASKYPGISIPERMIYAEATKRFRQLSKLHDVILQPYSLKDLFFTLNFFSKSGQIKDNLSEGEINELKPIYEYLTDSRRKKVYERYLERANNTPKTIVFYPSHGFKGYPEKLRELLPEMAAKARKVIYVDD